MSFSQEIVNFTNHSGFVNTLNQIFIFSSHVVSDASSFRKESKSENIKTVSVK